MAGGGYDISASISDATTQATSKTFGDFNVGGGVRLGKYFGYAALAVVALVVFFWFKRK